MIIILKIGRTEFLLENIYIYICVSNNGMKLQIMHCFAGDSIVL